MRIDWWTLGLQAVNLLVLVWILHRFLFRPITAMIAARQKAVAGLLDDAAARKAGAEAERAKAEAEVAATAAARREILEAAAAEAAQHTEALLAEAKIAADERRAANDAALAAARESATAEMHRQAGRLAVDIAARLLDRLPAEARIAGFVDGLAAAIADLPEATRNGIAMDGAPVAVKAPRALTVAETEACAVAFARSLGRPVELAVTVDPGLVAGLEIETPHAVVRNSLRADLNRIAAELTRSVPTRGDHAGQ